MTGYTRHISILGSKPHLPRKKRNLEQFQLYRLTCAASVVCGCSVWIMPRPIIGAQLGSNDAAQVRGLEPHTSQCLPCTLEIFFPAIDICLRSRPVTPDVVRLFVR